ncbi:DUF1479 family protein [Escherichia coli]|nr:DUF1479 family protein [Escherichia coli]
MASTFTSDTLPADHKAAIRQMKHALRAQLGDVQQIFNQLSDDIATRVAEINALKAQGDAVWPVLSYADIKAGHVTAEQREQIKRRGCAVIKGHFPREQALGWDQSMLDYLDRNRFDEVYKGPGDNFFGTLSASRPEIYPIYWSQAQMQARQSEEMAYVLLRPLLDDVPEDELCGVAPGRVLPVSEQWHPLLIEALTSIPKLEAGDSVWWHCDVIHSVAPVENQQGWGNVMYIPAAPMCEKNLAYAHKVKAALEKGASPGDFPREDYETNWEGRFTLADLNIHGKRALGMDV